MEFALGVLGWTPDALWRATPRELHAAIAGRLGPAAAPPIERRDLDALLARYPDRSAGRASRPAPL